MSTNNASTTCGYLSELINYINLPYELEAINHSYAYNWINESYVKRKEPPPPPTAVLDPDISGLGVRFEADYTSFLAPAEFTRSDQQIITGIAILVAGFAKRSNIMVYDWQLVTYLAWMSSGTHLITLSVLRIYLREYPQLRMWRICGMLMLFVMLFVAIMPTGSNNWYEIVYFEQPVLENVSECTSTFIPAKCFWNSKFWNAWRWEGALSYALLISNYVIRAGALFELNGQRFERWRPQVRIRAALDATVKDLAITSNKAWRRAGFPQRLHAEVKKPGSQPNTTDTNDTNGCQPNMIQLSSPEHASETSPILPSLPLEEPLSRTVLEATVHGDQSVLSSREDPAQPHSRPLIQSTQGIQAEANADEIELTGTSSKGNSDPLALLHPETGRLEAGISADVYTKSDDI
ncbi:uncharacterized protein KY384_001250 [Bacidia gigantensis]|uniref:uncharacterized protein n=1 Tax=Bacidia gigantensis TaxID=2732470 RepID=UPI001D058B5A|nr:uncharacterized protein KY384_001250 [Bacidia gigantensis]KAG8534405.1 hypothetical protein KY384_001250 [Bacidia gigantensis]